VIKPRTEGCPVLVPAFFAETEPCLSEAEGVGILISLAVPPFVSSQNNATTLKPPATTERPLPESSLLSSTEASF
jgi:hypothetical protein